MEEGKPRGEKEGEHSGVGSRGEILGELRTEESVVSENGGGSTSGRKKGGGKRVIWAGTKNRALKGGTVILKQAGEKGGKNGGG